MRRAYHGSVKAKKIYPTIGSKKTIEELQTVGIKLTADEARQLSKRLEEAAENNDSIDIKGDRNCGTVTITTK